MSQPIIDISIQHSEWTRAIRDIQNVVISVVALTLDKAEIEERGKELSIVLANNEFVQNLNKEWRDKDKPTNVLSFPQDEPTMFGDVVIAYETVVQEAEEQDKRFEDHATHLLVHGLLHLLGHNHEEDDEAEIMEALEVRILKSLNIKNPYEIKDFMP